MKARARRHSYTDGGYKVSGRKFVLNVMLSRQLSRITSFNAVFSPVMLSRQSAFKDIDEFGNARD